MVHSTLTPVDHRWRVFAEIHQSSILIFTSEQVSTYLKVVAPLPNFFFAHRQTTIALNADVFPRLAFPLIAVSITSGPLGGLPPRDIHGESSLYYLDSHELHCYCSQY
jgi:hypothetical protein